MGREKGVTLVPAKYRQGDDLLCMLAHAYKSNLCMGKWGNFERQSRLPGPTVVCYFVQRKMALEKLIQDIRSSEPSRTGK